MTLFERVKKIAKDHGYSLAELARRSEIGEKSIYTWKPSKTYPNGVTPSREVLEKVSNELGVSVDYLLGETDEKSVADKPKEVDIDDDDVIMTYQGRPIPEEDLEYIKRILNGGNGRNNKNGKE